LLDSGTFAPEVWRIPNELGDPNHVGGAVVPSQGPDGMFVIRDPNPVDGDDNPIPLGRPDGRVECLDAPDMPIDRMSAGTCGGMAQPACNRTPINYIDFSDEPAYVDICCEPVRHLCNLPLCTNDAQNVRRSPSSLRTDPRFPGRQIPNCVPFHMPQFCCTP
jgi:hypothetical protein